MLGKILMVLIIMLLVGCKEDKPKGKKVSKPKANPEHYKIAPRKKEKPKPKIVVKLPPKPVIDDFFPEDDKHIEWSLNAANRLGDIRQIHKDKLLKESDTKSDVVKEKLLYIMEEEDYKSINLAYDEFSYPVRRDTILTKDAIIPAVLEKGINSQISGRVTAKIYRNVYSHTMKYILLPAGSKIICDYEGVTKTGQSRLKVVCTEIIRPDGAIVALKKGGMNAGDMAGRQGLIGKVDNRTFEQYGGAFIMATISALAQTAGNLTTNATVSPIASQFSNDMGRITSKTIEKNLDLRPVISIEAGTKVLLQPLNNLYFRKPELIQQYKERTKDANT